MPHYAELRSLAISLLGEHAAEEPTVQGVIHETLRIAQQQSAQLSATEDPQYLDSLRGILREVVESSWQQGNRLHLALATLPTVQSQVIRLRLAQRWALARIASHLGLSDQTVVEQLRKGLRQLRHLLEEGGDRSDQ